MKARPMDSDGIIGVVSGAILVGILSAIYFAYRRRRRTKRLLIMELLKGYFQGDMPADKLAKRTREIAGRHFMRSAELYSLVITAFQGAMAVIPTDQTDFLENEMKLVQLLAALRTEFGLTPYYHAERVPM
jgi:hypothetical protein